jgi:hypothetical protein
LVLDKIVHLASGIYSLLLLESSFKVDFIEVVKQSEQVAYRLFLRFGRSWFGKRGVSPPERTFAVPIKPRKRTFVSFREKFPPNSAAISRHQALALSRTKDDIGPN